MEQKTFMTTDKQTYEEIGTVIDASADNGLMGELKAGDKVYFDAWLAAKYPTGEGDNYYWLVKWEDVRAVEYAESK